MAKSIMQARRECYICRELYNVVTVRGLEEHHIFQAPRRLLSERYGLKVYLCRQHHNAQREYSAHFDAGLQAWLKSRAQQAFEAEYGHDAWMAAFGKDYTNDKGGTR